MTATTIMRGCFVTGTDTEVGKTCISAALLHWCTHQSWRSAGYKPVAAGMYQMDGEWVNEDVRTLRQASSLALTDAEVGPLQFEAACAPHIAAALQGQTICRDDVLRGASHLAKRADVLIVEGVGGFCVPLNDTWDSADLAVDLQLPVVRVIGLRLGCINHALLTAQAVLARGLTLAGWVGNATAPDMPLLGENVANLRQRLSLLGAPCLGVVPYLNDLNPAAVVNHLDDGALHLVFEPVSTFLALT